MRDDVTKMKPRVNESAIINLDDSHNRGTHWVAYIKRNMNVKYFDSFGNLKPPLELMEYLGVSSVRYNYKRYQDFNSFNCGHLCLKFLNNTLYKDRKTPFGISLH